MQGRVKLAFSKATLDEETGSKSTLGEALSLLLFNIVPGVSSQIFDRCITKCYTVPQDGLGRCVAKFIRAIQTCYRIGPDAWRGFRDSSPAAWNSPIVTIVTFAFPSCRGLKFVWRERSATIRSEKRQHRVMSLSQNTSC